MLSQFAANYPKAKIVFTLLNMSMRCEHVHGLELQKSFKFWVAVAAYSKCAEKPVDQLFLFWTRRSEFKSRPFHLLTDKCAAYFLKKNAHF